MMNFFSFSILISITQQGIAAMERIQEILLYPTEEEPKIKPLSKNLSKKDKKNLTINVKNLSYTYPRKKERALDNVSFQLNPSKILGITGETGGGKTTLVNLICGFLKPQRGCVFLDGVDLLDINKETLYEHLSVIPQETFLFSSTLENNIGFSAPKNPVTKKVVHASRMADLEKDILLFPNQYQQIVGERGITLSGGQKQRTAIARSIYKTSNIMIFDDSLSNVDSETEQNILKKIETLKGNTTLILVSHRVAVLKMANEIIYLQNGKIAERGTHHALLKQNGFYKKIANIQKIW